MLTRDQIVTDTPSKDYDHLFKVVMVGDPGVGKSSVLLRFADDLFNDNYYSTIGVDFRFKTLQIGDRCVKLQIWDTAGQEKFRCLTNAYYKGANAIVLVFDITNRQSFENLGSWMSQISQYVDTNPLIMILGAKSDLMHLQCVSHEELEQYAAANNCHGYVVSAKTNSLVIESFVDLVKTLIDKQPEAKPRRSLLNVGDPYKRQQDPYFDSCCL